MGATARGWKKTRVREMEKKRKKETTRPKDTRTQTSISRGGGKEKRA